MHDGRSEFDQWADEVWAEIRERLPEHMKDDPKVAHAIGFLFGYGTEKIGWRIVSWLLFRDRR